MSGRRIDRMTVLGFDVHVDEALGHLWVEHDGTIGWEDLQTIKNLVWDAETRAIEVYPRQSELVNSKNIRHLWRLGENDFCPDLLTHDRWGDSLQSRHAMAWAEAEA